MPLNETRQDRTQDASTPVGRTREAVGVTPNLQLSSRPTWRDLMVADKTRHDGAQDASTPLGMTREAVGVMSGSFYGVA